MFFNSIEFCAYFIVFWGVYWSIPASFNKIKKWFLILFSYLLYMNWKPSFALVLFGITSVSFITGLILDSEYNIPRRRKLLLYLVSLILLPLLVFKYSDFFTQNVLLFLQFWGLKFSMPGLNWAVPIGISFYTFQAVGYVLDVYYKKIKKETCFTDFILFCSFFPQSICGPISRYSELSPQIKELPSFNYEKIRRGAQYLLLGFVFKMVIADRIGVYVDLVYQTFQHQSSITCIFASFCYSFQIYADFAGYSLMAVGLALLLGIKIINNFNRPYLAASVTEFWKRWHISLTRWLTSYVYIPLGGNRCSKYRQYLNIFITFLVSGLWHGANWTFLVWGGLHSLFQVFEKAFFGEKIKSEIKSGCSKLSFSRLSRVIFTFVLVSFAWIFFRMPSLVDALDFIKHIFSSNFSGFFAPQPDTTILLFLSLTLIILIDIVGEFKPLWSLFNSEKVIVRWMSYFLLLSWLLLAGVFDASNFIYANF